MRVVVQLAHWVRTGCFEVGARPGKRRVPSIARWPPPPGAAIESALEFLESRTMLSGTPGPISGPVPAVPDGPMFNLVLEPSAGGSLGSLAGEIARAGGTAEATGLPGYFLVQAPAEEVGPLETQLAASPAVEYAAAPRTAAGRGFAQQPEL